MTKIKRKVVSLATAFMLAFAMIGLLPENVLKANAAGNVSYDGKGTLTISGNVTFDDMYDALEAYVMSDGIYLTSVVTNIVAAPGTVLTDCSRLFSGYTAVTKIDLSKADVSNVTRMDGMFNNCKSLIEMDLSRFNTSKVTSMGQMFAECSSLQKVTLSGLNTSNVTDMHQMFLNCSSLKNIDLSSFTLDGFAQDWYNQNSLSWMFKGCTSLETVNISGFNTYKVKDMSEMFNGCSNLVTIYGPDVFDISGLMNDSFASTKYGAQQDMFKGCTKLVGGNKTSFNSAYVDATYARVDKAGRPGYFTAGSTTEPNPDPDPDPEPEITYYGIRVNGREFTNVSNGYSGISYNPTSNELIINHSTANNVQIENYGADNLTIYVKQSTTVKNLVLDKKTTITGSGKLTLSTTTGAAIKASADLTLENANIKAVNADYGLQGVNSPKLTINNSTVYINAKTASADAFKSSIALSGCRMVYPAEAKVDGGKIASKKALILPNSVRLMGDVTGTDKSVDEFDARYLARCAAEWEGYPATADVIKYGDFDGDGEITRIDANILARIDNEWEGYWEKYVIAEYIN